MRVYTNTISKKKIDKELSGDLANHFRQWVYLTGKDLASFSRSIGMYPQLLNGQLDSNAKKVFFLEYVLRCFQYPEFRKAFMQYFSMVAGGVFIEKKDSSISIDSLQKTSDYLIRIIVHYKKKGMILPADKLKLRRELEKCFCAFSEILEMTF